MSLMTCGHASASTQIRMLRVNTTNAYTEPVSKAFTNEDTPIPDDADAVPPRAESLPITPAGAARLQQELRELTHAGSSEVGARRARVIAQTLKSIYIVEPSAPGGRVAFGARATVEDADGRL